MPERARTLTGSMSGSPFLAISAATPATAPRNRSPTRMCSRLRVFPFSLLPCWRFAKVTSMFVAAPLVLSAISTVIVSRCNERAQGSNPPRRCSARFAMCVPGRRVRFLTWPLQVCPNSARSEAWSQTLSAVGRRWRHNAARRRLDAKDGGCERGAVGG